jgi:small multidrug resistance pump
VSWTWLVAAILLEVCGTTSMKLSQGFTRPGPSVAIYVFYGASIVALTFAVRRIDLAVAYAVWSGLGTGLIAAIGFVWFGEPATAARLAGIGLVIAGVVLLRVAPVPAP